MARLLVPIDGSDKDARALAVAAGLAYLTDGDVHLVRVFVPGNDVASSKTTAEQAVREQAQHLASELTRAVTWDVAESPNVADVLLDRARTTDATLVVMATRAPGAVGRAVHGSVADRIARDGSRPVVLVPPGADFLRGKHLHLRRILVPLDGSVTSLRVIDALLSFSRARELELVLVEVVPPLHGDDRGRLVTAEQRLDAVATRLSDRVARAEVLVVEAHDPAAAIVNLVREELVELIAMTTRGAGGIDRLVFGSVATEVVRRSEVSVLLVTPA